MRRLRGCLSALPSFDERVLRLRTGIGTSPRTRRQVAQRLDVSAGRVRSAERSGLSGLRAADREFGCAGAGGASSGSDGANGSGGSVGLAIAATSSGFGDDGVGSAMAAAGGGATDGTRAEGDVAGVRASSEEEPSVQSVDPAAAKPPIAASDDSEKSEPSLLLLLLAGAAVLALLALIALLRRRSSASSDEPEAGRAEPAPAKTAAPAPAAEPDKPAPAAIAKPASTGVAKSEPPPAPDDVPQRNRRGGRLTAGLSSGAGVVGSGFRDLGRDVQRRVRSRRGRKREP